MVLNVRYWNKKKVLFTKLLEMAGIKNANC